MTSYAEYDFLNERNDIHWYCDIFNAGNYIICKNVCRVSTMNYNFNIWMHFTKVIAKVIKQNVSRLEINIRFFKTARGHQISQFISV